MAHKVLIVDDDLLIRQVLRYSLRRAGYEVLEAANGPDALASVSGDRPDVLLLDLMMPDVNGFAICSALRANPATRGLPIIMLTARADDQARDLGMSAGANAYLTKPVHPDELVACVRRVLAGDA